MNTLAVPATPLRQDATVIGLVGLAEGVSRRLVERGQHFDPDVLGQQIADLAWAGLRAVHRAG